MEVVLDVQKQVRLGWQHSHLLERDRAKSQIRQRTLENRSTRWSVGSEEDHFKHS